MKGQGETAWFLLVYIDDFIAAALTDTEVQQIYHQTKE